MSQNIEGNQADKTGAVTQESHEVAVEAGKAVVEGAGKVLRAGIAKMTGGEKLPAVLDAQFEEVRNTLPIRARKAVDGVLESAVAHVQAAGEVVKAGGEAAKDLAIDSYKWQLLTNGTIGQRFRSLWIMLLVKMFGGMAKRDLARFLTLKGWRPLAEQAFPDSLAKEDASAAKREQNAQDRLTIPA